VGDPKQQVRTTQELLRDGELCRLFIVKLMRDNVAFSVPRAARRYLSAARIRLKAPTLNGDELLTSLIRGFERQTPRTKVQANSIEADDVQRIVDLYGCVKDWWKTQVAVCMSIGFVTLLRMGELLRLKIQDVRLVLHGGREVSVETVDRLPTCRDVRGAFLHVCWRKASQRADVWVPMACSIGLSMLLRQLRMLRREGRTVGWLFTSRTRKGGRRSHSPPNPLGSQAAVTAMRETLQIACGMSLEQAMLYKGHSLRVGGSNHIRKLGVEDEVHRLLGGWASLVSSRGYFDLNAEEQMRLCERMALKEREPPGEASNRPLTLDSVNGLSLGVTREVARC